MDNNRNQTQQDQQTQEALNQMAQDFMAEQERQRQEDLKRLQAEYSGNADDVKKS